MQVMNTISSPNKLKVSKISESRDKPVVYINNKRYRLKKVEASDYSRCIKETTQVANHLEKDMKLIYVKKNRYRSPEPLSPSSEKALAEDFKTRLFLVINKQQEAASVCQPSRDAPLSSTEEKSKSCAVDFIKRSTKRRNNETSKCKKKEAIRILSPVRYPKNIQVGRDSDEENESSRLNKKSVLNLPDISSPAKPNHAFSIRPGNQVERDWKLKQRCRPLKIDARGRAELSPNSRIQLKGGSSKVVSPTKLNTVCNGRRNLRAFSPQYISQNILDSLDFTNNSKSDESRHRRRENLQNLITNKELNAIKDQIWSTFKRNNL